MSAIALASIGTFVFEFFRGDFGIPVFANNFDFFLIFALFISLGFFAVVEVKLSDRAVLIYEGVTTALCAGYLFARPFLPFETIELRFSQLLAVLSLLGTIVYVVAHRRKHPHL